VEGGATNGVVCLVCVGRKSAWSLRLVKIAGWCRTAESNKAGAQVSSGGWAGGSMCKCATVSVESFPKLYCSLDVSLPAICRPGRKFPLVVLFNSTWLGLRRGKEEASWAVCSVWADRRVNLYLVNESYLYAVCITCVLCCCNVAWLSGQF